MLTESEIENILDELFNKFSEVLADSQKNRDEQIQLVSMFPQILKAFIAAELININAKTKEGETLLHSAVARGNSAAVMGLVFSGADINIEYKFKTPLYHAIYLGYSEISEFLIRSRANLEVKFYGETLLDTALKRSQDQIAAMLITYGAQRTDGFNKLQETDIARYNLIVTISKLYKKKYISFIFPKEENLRLISDEIKKAIFAFGFVEELTRIIKGGEVKLLKAFFREFPDIMNFLLKLDVEIDGKTFIHHIANMRDLNFIKYLIKSGIDLDYVYSDGETLLHYLTDFMDEDIIAYLIDNGALIDIPNRDGITAFMKIIEWCDVAGVENLIAQSGINIQVTDNYGRGLVHHATIGSNLNVLKLLVEKYGLDLYAKDKEGKTVKDIAITNEIDDIMVWLNEMRILEYMKIVPGITDFTFKAITENNSLFKFFESLINNLENMLLYENEEETESIMLQIETIFQDLAVSEAKHNLISFSQHSENDFSGDDPLGGGGGASGLIYNAPEGQNNFSILPFVGNNTGQHEY